MLKWRLILGASFIALLVVLCWLDAQADRPGMQPGLPSAALMPVLLLLTVLATQEVLGLAAAAGIRPVAWPIYAGNVLLVLAQWFPEVNLYVLRRLSPAPSSVILPTCNSSTPPAIRPCGPWP